MVSPFQGSKGIPSLTKYYNDVNVPKAKDLMIELQEYVQQGILTPEEAATYFLQETGLQSAALDPSTRAAQIAAMEALKTKADEGGLDAIARANLREALGEGEVQERGNQEKIMADARARGLGGSGVELANRLLSQQGSASRAAKASLETAAQAEAGRMSALKEMAALGGTVRSQDYEQAKAKAEAQDLINKFNTTNQQQQENAKIQARNQAQAQNLALKQGIANMNTGVYNQQEIYNKQVPQTVYQDKMAKANALAGARQAQTAQETAADAAAYEAWGGVVNAVNPAGQMMSSDERGKKEVEKFDPSSVLDALVPVKYKYKNPEAPGASPGEQVGFMAQDLEKAGLGSSVVEDKKGSKFIDYQKATPQMLAVMASALKDLTEEVRGGK